MVIVWSAVHTPGAPSQPRGSGSTPKINQATIIINTAKQRNQSQNACIYLRPPLKTRRSVSLWFVALSPYLHCSNFPFRFPRVPFLGPSSCISSYDRAMSKILFTLAWYHDGGTLKPQLVLSTTPVTNLVVKGGDWRGARFGNTNAGDGARHRFEYSFTGGKSVTRASL